jgi:KipI family sensor histidine kinase inhibitor
LSDLQGRKFWQSVRVMQADTISHPDAQPDEPPVPVAVPGPVRLLDAGDAAITIEFGDTVDPALVARVQALDAAIEQGRRDGGLPGLIESMPTFRSLTVFFDPLVTSRAALIRDLEPLFDAPVPPGRAAARHWELPACYDAEMAPDLLETAQALGLAPDAVVDHHSRTVFTVYMLGFMPGFPFMGDLPAALHRPRRTEPRVRVPAGSVSIALGLTAIYPWESPGGWHLIARCPARLFDASRSSPALLAPGDRVRFKPVDVAEFRRLDEAVRGGELDGAQWQVAPPSERRHG